MTINLDGLICFEGKIELIKFLRQGFKTLGLKEAKDAVEIGLLCYYLEQRMVEVLKEPAGFYQQQKLRNIFVNLPNLSPNVPKRVIREYFGLED